MDGSRNSDKLVALCFGGAVTAVLVRYCSHRRRFCGIDPELWARLTSAPGERERRIPPWPAGPRYFTQCDGERGTALSTLHEVEVEIGGQKYPTPEHYVLAAGVGINSTLAEKIRCASLVELGPLMRSVAGQEGTPCRPADAVLEVMRAKFRQRPMDRKHLCGSSVGLPLIELGPRPTSVGIDIEGQEYAQLLMQIRDELRHPDIVPLASAEGLHRLSTSASHLCAFKGFRKQRHSRACAAVSAGLVLHNMGLTTYDGSSDWLVYRLDGVEEARPQTQTQQGGMTLPVLADVIASQAGVCCTATHAAEAAEGAAELRAAAETVFSGPASQRGLIANFATSVYWDEPRRCERGEPTWYGGHVSPCGAYHRGSDSILVIDTWDFVPVGWIPVQLLYEAMAGGTDSETKRSRGWIVVERTSDNVMKSRQ